MQEEASTVSGGSSLASSTVPTVPFTTGHPGPDRPQTRTQLHQIICKSSPPQSTPSLRLLGLLVSMAPDCHLKPQQEPTPSRCRCHIPPKNILSLLLPRQSDLRVWPFCTLVFYWPPRFCLSDLYPHLHASPPLDGEAGPRESGDPSGRLHICLVYISSLFSSSQTVAVGMSVGTVKNCFKCV